MTYATADSQAVGGNAGQLLTAVQETHGPWLEESRKLLDSARSPEAGIHTRWSAIHYLTTTVSHRFELERTAVESLGQMVDPGHAAQLWVAAELMATLLWQVDHSVGLCHRSDEFSTLTHKLDKAMVHWCRAVENALSRVRWGDIPEQARRRFALLGEEVHHDA